MHARHMLSFRQIKIRQMFKNTIWRHFCQINFPSNFPAIQYVLIRKKKFSKYDKNVASCVMIIPLCDDDCN